MQGSAAAARPGPCQPPAAAAAAMMKLLPLLLLLLPSQSRALQHSNSNALFGAYLGCFSLSRMLYMRGVEGKEGKQYTVDSIRQCMPDCKYNGYSLSIITPDYRCWCAISTPDVQAQLEEAACATNSERGAAVFYHHELAGQQRCRLEALPLTADTVQLASSSSAVFDGPAQTMTLGLQGSSASHAAVTGSDMLYGQVEVTAMVNAASGEFSTAFYLQSSSSSSSSTSSVSPKDSTDRISYQFVAGGSPPVPNSVLMSSTTRGAAMGELLMKPGEYQKRLGLGSNSRVNNTFVDYTISWQSSRVTFAMDGIPVVTRKGGQEVKWMDASSKQRSAMFSPPSQPASVHFGVWSSHTTQQQQQQPGQPAMLPNGLPALSQFTALKRIVCDQSVSAAATHHRSVRGPPWLYVGQSWDASDGFVGAEDDVTPNTSSSDEDSWNNDTPDDAASSAGSRDVVAAASVHSVNHAGFDLHQSLPFGWPGVRVSSRALVKPAPPAPGTALAGKYAGGFTVTVSPTKKISIDGLGMAGQHSMSGSGSAGGFAGFVGSRADYAQQLQQDLQQPQAPVAIAAAGASSSSSTGQPASCRVAVVPFGVCGGASLFGDCLGHKCRDAPWPGHCCKQGFECSRQSSQLWSCKPPTACPPSSSSAAGNVCEWEVLRGGVCGGLGGGCEGCQCRDGQWPGFCCAEGLVCSRRSRWAWTCE